MTASVLVDIGRCIDCETCTAACTLNRGLPVEENRALWTRIHGFEMGEFPDVRALFTKRQCMHCEEPTCVSVCPVGALQKTANGPVIYDAHKCIGCRYCVTACPFGVPKLSWDGLFPTIQKCDFCADRQAAGLEPACVATCPADALKFGDRDTLLLEAKERIQASGGEYVNHVYGEHEVGGLSWLYISKVPFDKLGFPSVGETPYLCVLFGGLVLRAVVVIGGAILNRIDVSIVGQMVLTASYLPHWMEFMATIGLLALAASWPIP